MKIEIQPFTHKGKVRQANEDNFGIKDKTPNGDIYVVCDGMGGHVGGAKASEIGAKSIVEYFSKEKYDNIIIAINSALKYANEQIFAHANEDPSLKGMGTTAVVLIVQGEDIYIGHVGDSRIYLKSNNKLNRLTKDHSHVQGLVDQKIITDTEALTHPKKNQILKALGIKETVEGTVCESPIKASKGDVFLLCSDGLNDMVHDELIEAIIEDDLDLTSQNLYNTAMENGGKDNITFILLKVIESESKTSIFKSFNPNFGAVPNDTDTDQFSGTDILDGLEEEEEKLNAFQKLMKSRYWVLIPIVLLTISFVAIYTVFFDTTSKNIPITKNNECISKDSIRKLPKNELIDIGNSNKKLCDCKSDDTEDTIKIENILYEITLKDKNIKSIKEIENSESENLSKKTVKKVKKKEKKNETENEKTSQPILKKYSIKDSDISLYQIAEGLGVKAKDIWKTTCDNIDKTTFSKMQKAQFKNSNGDKIPDDGILFYYKK